MVYHSICLPMVQVSPPRVISKEQSHDFKNKCIMILHQNSDCRNISCDYLITQWGNAAFNFFFHVTESNHCNTGVDMIFTIKMRKLEF